MNRPQRSRIDSVAVVMKTREEHSSRVTTWSGVRRVKEADSRSLAIALWKQTELCGDEGGRPLGTHLMVRDGRDRRGETIGSNRLEY
jgi:hypothetical protein